MRSSRLPTTGIALALVGVLVTGALASPEAPEAAPVPAAGEPFPPAGSYRGMIHFSEELVTRGLACNVVGPELSCYDTQAEAAAAGALVAEDPPSSAATCSPPLTVWWDPGFSGGSLSYYAYPGWQNLPSSWRNQTSSWRSGCRAGRLSDYTGGGGNQIGLPAGQSASVMPSGWDNRADAIYRY